MRGLHHRLFGRLAVVLAVLTAALVFAASALAAANISVTFVRHAESQANADGIINTQVPGPNITNPVGTQQAIDIAAALAGNGYDGIYASDMVRTQQTAAPLATLLGKPVTILPGLHEISAGIYEGSSEDDGLGRLGYALSPLLWTLGARGVPIPGSTDPDGNAFEARVNGAMQAIYDSGDVNAVAFSHGATIMFWTMMNVDNPDLGLLLTHQLGNTGVVVVQGNPEDGWKLVSWDGVAVDPDPSFVTKLFVNFRDLVTTPQAAAYAVGQALQSGDLIKAASEFVRGTVATLWAPIKFGVSVVGDVIDLLLNPTATQPTDSVTQLKTAVADSAPQPTVRLSAAAAESDAPDTGTVDSAPPSGGASLTLVKSAAAEPVGSGGQTGDTAANPTGVVAPGPSDGAEDERSRTDAGPDVTPTATATDADTETDRDDAAVEPGAPKADAAAAEQDDSEGTTTDPDDGDKTPAASTADSGASPAASDSADEAQQNAA